MASLARMESMGSSPSSLRYSPSALSLTSLSLIHIFRYHNGVYYVLVPFPDEGIMVSRTTDPWGVWSRLEYVKKVTGWIDPCPFWDDDGKAYMVSAFAKSRVGLESWLYLSPMKEDCSELTGEGKFIYDGHETQPTIEGPKLYRRNGYYYIFAPAGGVTNGWQTVLRSRNIEGPYEERIVLRQGTTPVSYTHLDVYKRQVSCRAYR